MNPSPAGDDALALLAGLDIYLFDQVVKGRIHAGQCVADIGCGGGRNLAWLLRHGARIMAADPDPAAVAQMAALVRALAPDPAAVDLRVEPAEALTFPEGAADVVILSAVLHFARDEAHFDAMLAGAWRVLRPGGLFFARLASSIGLEGRTRPLGGRRHLLPDGSERFLVDEAFLEARVRALGATPLEPLKTTLVAGQRSMTTWVLRKG